MKNLVKAIEKSYIAKVLKGSEMCKKIQYELLFLNLNSYLKLNDVKDKDIRLSKIKRLITK